MKNRFASKASQGFSLLELVIVLGVTGIIFGGLWGLLGSSSSQVRAQSSAQAYRQVIDATRKLLSAPTASFLAAVPAYANCSAGITLTPAQIKTYLGTSATSLALPSSDSYGALSVRAYCNNATYPNPNNDWKFSVYGVTGIDDKTGAQISALIGNEGGFVYSKATDNCTTAATAPNISCGTYNAFTVTLTTMGISNGSGKVVTYSTTANYSITSAPWLARLKMAAAPSELNTLQADTEVYSTGNVTIYMHGNTLDFAKTRGGATNTYGVITGISAITGGQNLDVGVTTTSNYALTLKSKGGNINLNNLNMTMTSSAGITATIAANNTFFILGGSTGTRLLSVNGSAFALELQAGAFYYQSDETLKENIRPLTDALDKIAGLRGVSFDWREAEGHKYLHDIGLVAQEVQKMFPQAVAVMPGGKLGVDYPRMVAPMIEAIRTLKLENDALKARLDKLEAAKEKK